jgi:hypothetical protein
LAIDPGELHLSRRLFIRLASEKYKRPLMAGERIRQAMHRMMCSLCRIQERRIDQLQILAHEVGGNSTEGGRAELSSACLERIRKAMADAAAHLGPSGGSKS